LFLVKMNPSFLSSDLASSGLNPHAWATRFSSPRSRIRPRKHGLCSRYSLIAFIIQLPSLIISLVETRLIPPCMERYIKTEPNERQIV
jgi:hypothetical protein